MDAPGLSNARFMVGQKEKIAAMYPDFDVRHMPAVPDGICAPRSHQLYVLRSTLVATD